MNFSQPDKTGGKVRDVSLALVFPKEEKLHTGIHTKMGEIHELCVLAPLFGDS